MFRTWLLLAALVARLASGQALAYASDSIVNGANFTPGPFAPNSIVTIFGANLAFGTAALPSPMTALPLELADAEVYITDVTSPGGGYRIPLMYVSPTQINLLLPSNLPPGVTKTIFVVRQGVAGPNVNITLVAADPQVFATSDGYVIAQHADYSQITPSAPASPGETIIVYATGLGATQPNADPTGVVPQYPSTITTALTVLLNGTAVSSDLIKYAGLTPGSAGVYQVNLLLPSQLDPDPEVRLSAGGLTSTPGTILATQPSSN